MIYVVLNLFVMLIFLFVVGLVYGVSGMLNMGELVVIMCSGEVLFGVILVLLLMLLLFVIKVVLFLVFGWLLVIYYVVFIVVLVMFVGFLIKVGVYALICLEILS